MTKSPITLQELRRRIYVKAKAEKSWSFFAPRFPGAQRRQLPLGQWTAVESDGCTRLSDCSITEFDIS